MYINIKNEYTSPGSKFLKKSIINFPVFWRPNKKLILPGSALKKDLHVTNDVVTYAMLTIVWLVA